MAMPKFFTTTLFPEVEIIWRTLKMSFIDECKKLATGMWAFDSHEKKTFKLHVYPILVHGNMMAIKYAMNFKGPNGKHPCHTCHISGVQDTLHTYTPFYVPLTIPCNQGSGSDTHYNPYNLPLHSNSTYRSQLIDIKNAHSIISRTQHEKDYGINGECILTKLPSILILRSFLHDWMHLCLENHW